GKLAVIRPSKIISQTAVVCSIVLSVSLTDFRWCSALHDLRLKKVAGLRTAYFDTRLVQWFPEVSVTHGFPLRTAIHGPCALRGPCGLGSPHGYSILTGTQRNPAHQSKTGHAGRSLCHDGSEEQ